MILLFYLYSPGAGGGVGGAVGVVLGVVLEVLEVKIADVCS